MSGLVVVAVQDSEAVVFVSVMPMELFPSNPPSVDIFR